MCRQEGRQHTQVLAVPLLSSGTTQLWWGPLRTPLQHPPQLGWVAIPKSPRWLSGEASFFFQKATVLWIPRGCRTMSLQRWLGVYLQHPDAGVPQ